MIADANSITLTFVMEVMTWKRGIWVNKFTHCHMVHHIWHISSVLFTGLFLL